MRRSVWRSKIEWWSATSSNITKRGAASSTWKGSHLQTSAQLPEAHTSTHTQPQWNDFCEHSKRVMLISTFCGNPLNWMAGTVIWTKLSDSFQAVTITEGQRNVYESIANCYAVNLRFGRTLLAGLPRPQMACSYKVLRLWSAMRCFFLSRIFGSKNYTWSLFYL